MKKLNLHLHTNYSDGHSTMKEYGEVMKKLNFECLVTSDHDYSLTLEGYEAQKLEAEDVSRVLDFPIINALEISLYYEEAILIGNRACKDWFRVMDVVNFNLRCKDVTFFKEWLKRFEGEYLLILVHPFVTDNPEKRIDELYDLFDGYEVGNHGSWCWLESKGCINLMPNKLRVAGIDAHGLGFVLDETLGSTFLYTEQSIKNEKELIETLKKGLVKISYGDKTL